MHDTRALGEAYFQASLIAERDGHWVLARTYAERAKSQYEELTDRINVGRLLNNLGGLEFLLGKPDEAVARLKEAFAIALEHGNDDDAATAISSLAQVHLRTGNLEKAEEHARHALRLLGTREDRLDEIGNARLVLGRALLEQGRLDEAEAALAEAEDAFAQLSSGSHRAAAWVAQGDLAQRRGDDRRAATLYRPPPRRSRTSGSKPREEVKTVATRLAMLISRRRLMLTIVSVAAALVGARAGHASTSPVSGTA